MSDDELREEVKRVTKTISEGMTQSNELGEIRGKLLVYRALKEWADREIGRLMVRFQELGGRIEE